MKVFPEMCTKFDICVFIVHETKDRYKIDRLTSFDTWLENVTPKYTVVSVLRITMNKSIVTMVISCAIMVN